MNIDVNKVMEQLAMAFNTTVDKMYPMLIKQAYISGIINTLIGITAIVILVVGTKIAYKYWEQIYDVDGDFAVWCVGGLYAVIAVIAVPILLHSGITALLNPEYWALKEILSTLAPRN